MSDQNSQVKIKLDDKVAFVTLDNPKAINALSEAMLAQLQTAFDELATNDDVRAIVLRTEGSRRVDSVAPERNETNAFESIRSIVGRPTRQQNPKQGKSR